MKIGDLVKVRDRPFHAWNGIIVGWHFDQPEVLVLENKNGTTGVTVPFVYYQMEVVSERG